MATSWLQFDLGERSYAIPLDAVAEVMWAQRPRLIPLVPPDVGGVLNIRGEPLVVMNGGAVFGLDAGAAKAEGPELSGARPCKRRGSGARSEAKPSEGGWPAAARGPGPAGQAPGPAGQAPGPARQAPGPAGSLQYRHVLLLARGDSRIGLRVGHVSRIDGDLAVSTGREENVDEEYPFVREVHRADGTLGLVDLDGFLERATALLTQSRAHQGGQEPC